MHRPATLRLVAFVLVIFGSFGTAYAVGRRLPGNPESKPHTHGKPVASPIPPGFTVDGYTLVNDANQPTASAVALHVRGPDGHRVTQYAESHGATLHVVLIRPDLSGFQHVHPDISADGTFVVPLEHGKWHIVVDGQPAGTASPIVLSTNVDDEVPTDAVTLPHPADEVTVDDLTVTRHGLAFTVTGKDGSAVQGLEPYLGQAAHLIVIRKGDLAYQHLHPVDTTSATFAFDGTIPAGTYRYFLQFGYRGAVQTAAFTVVQP